MSGDEDFSEIEPTATNVIPTAGQMHSGVPVPPVRLLQVMSADDWEAFTEEWLSYHKSQGEYYSVKRYSGAGDLGLDVVAFTTANAFAEPWDGYQCKHYNHALTPNDIRGEIAKIVYHSFKRTPPFNQNCRTPRRHIFVSPLGVGITVGRLFADPARLKEDIREKWESYCVSKIGKNITAPLKGELLKYFELFDFSIFDSRTGAELIEDHSKTVFHAPRFGGCLPPREDAPPPPSEPISNESLYLRKLMDAYSDHLDEEVNQAADLVDKPELEAHYARQRELFYSAEALRNFARDRTPPRTFDTLQDDIFYGVIDICESKHADALERLRKTVTTAAQVDVSGNALVSVTLVPDKQGICHQLANEDRLTWKKVNE